jgi:hypothetical protein
VSPPPPPPPPPPVWPVVAAAGELRYAGGSSTVVGSAAVGVVDRWLPALLAGPATCDGRWCLGSHGGRPGADMGACINSRHMHRTEEGSASEQQYASTHSRGTAVLLLTRRARNSLGTATQCTHDARLPRSTASARGRQFRWLPRQQARASSTAAYRARRQRRRPSLHMPARGRDHRIGRDHRVGVCVHAGFGDSTRAHTGVRSVRLGLRGRTACCSWCHHTAASSCHSRGTAVLLLTRRARNSLGTATQCTRMNDSPPQPP